MAKTNQTKMALIAPNAAEVIKSEGPAGPAAVAAHRRFSKNAKMRGHIRFSNQTMNHMYGVAAAKNTIANTAKVFLADGKG